MDRPSYPPNFRPARPASAGRPLAREATRYLERHDKFSALLPALARIVALQKECTRLLPAIFAQCSVLNCEADQLMISAPNGAIAARLRQCLPQLRAGLAQAGWHVERIRIKVHMASELGTPPPAPLPMRVMPRQALDALSGLQQTLDASDRNSPLQQALQRLLAHQRGT